MRRSMSMLAVSTMVGALLVPGMASAGSKPGAPGDDVRGALQAGLQLAPKSTSTAKAPTGVNPYLALLPDPAKADYAGWRNYLSTKAKQRARERPQTLAVEPMPQLVDEEEPDGTNGGNDTPLTGQRIGAFGTGDGKNPKARVLGKLSPDEVTGEAVAATPEDDGAIPLAGDTGIKSVRAGITTSATIGDGPHGSTGSGSGDFDFYKFEVVAGDTVTVDIDTPTGALDSMVLLYNEAGEVVDINDDSGGELDSLLIHEFTAPGTFYAMVTGFNVRPNDPSDSASGPGADSEGPYQVSMTVGRTDTDFFAVRLRKGDVLGASVTGAPARITIYDTVPREVHGSGQDASFIYSINTPLPGGGTAVTEHVADRTGWYYVGVGTGKGDYDITVEAFRPGPEGKRVTQTLFLDFDGARLNTAIFAGPGVRTLSPMRAFLAKWGLTAADEDAVIDAVVDKVRESIRQDLMDSGLNSRFAVRVLNSRDHADPFGQPWVSRVIVGGTIAESGVSTIGIAQAIDPGNFGGEESALVLLDTLSASGGDDTSLNTYITGASDKVDFVGRALGNVTAHEAGHFFGNWHVDQFNERADLMDQGGNFPALYGVGPDQVGGTDDDPDVDFGEDPFNPSEGFTGVENTAARPAFGLTR